MAAGWIGLGCDDDMAVDVIEGDCDAIDHEAPNQCLGRSASGQRGEIECRP
jgi:hypothetical protein